MLRRTIGGGSGSKKPDQRCPWRVRLSFDHSQISASQQQRSGPSGHSRTATEVHLGDLSVTVIFHAGRGDLSIGVASFAVPAIDADRYRPVDRHATHDAWLVAVIIDRLVLRRAIVPDHYIASRPALAH